MNYERIYNQIIDKAKNENRQKVKKDNENYIYYEKHHIIPKCMNGDDSKDNLVLLTAREHYLVHWLLVEIYPKNNKLRFAFWGMCQLKNINQENRHIPNSRIYEYSKMLMLESKSQLPHPNKGKHISEEMKQKLRDANLGKRHSEETKSMMSEYFKLKIKQNPHLKKNLDNTGKHHSIESIEKIRNSNLGKKRSEETKLNISKARANQIIGPHCAEVKIKLKAAWVRKKFIKCPHCTKESKSASAMSQWHFDKCKFKK